MTHTERVRQLNQMGLLNICAAAPKNEMSDEYTKQYVFTCLTCKHTHTSIIRTYYDECPKCKRQFYDLKTNRVKLPKQREHD